MAIIKCKMCGGDMELSADKAFGICEYCGSAMTLPRIDSEQRAAAFNRGNHFRRLGDFDKALEAYERIVAEDETDAEAHWCCVLCRFGIAYVEDPDTYEYIPTCHRASFDSILEDVDYQAALEHSDGVTRRQYQREAVKIAEVQRGILAASQREAPFDVFLCYKESDENGARTVDSTLAQDIYYQLTEAGYRVFFARVTLEDKAGTEYEPYIFAALHSARVMVAVGTKPEHFNAVWVKNEWSRFLALMRQDRSKLLLPCYRDMDPHDLPEQLGILQSYDMGKIGFVQDLIRGVGKVLDAGKPESDTVVADQTAAGVQPLLKRVFLFLEDGDWKRADEYCEKVLDMDPECALAYVGKLMAAGKVRKQEELANLSKPVDDDGMYRKALRFADSELGDRLKGYNQQIRKRNEDACREEFYREAVAAMMSAQTEDDYKKAAKGFSMISTWKDAEQQSQACLMRAEEAAKARKERIYAEASGLMSGGKTEEDFQTAAAGFHEIHDWKDAARKEAACLKLAEEVGKDTLYREAAKEMETGKSKEDFQKAAYIFSRIPGWKDADVQAQICEKRVLEIAEKERLETERTLAERVRKAKRNRLVMILAGVLALLTIAASIIDTQVRIPAENYAKAEALLADGETEKAAMAFHKLGGYRDAKERYLALWNTLAAHDTLAAFDGNTACLKADGTVLAVGDYTKYVKPNMDGPDWENVVSIGVGCGGIYGLREDGTVAVAGVYTKASAEVAKWRYLVDIASAGARMVGLKADGTVVSTAYIGLAGYYAGECEVSGWTDIVAIAASSTHTVGLKSDGTVVATKYTGASANDHGQCEVSGWTDIVAIAASGTHTVGLKSDGTVVATKYTGASANDHGQCEVSGWTDIVAIAASGTHTVGLKSDGTVVVTKYTGDRADYHGQCNVSGWRDIVAIAAGAYHTVGLRSDGTVVVTKFTGNQTAYEGECDVLDWKNIRLPE